MSAETIVPPAARWTTLDLARVYLSADGDDAQDDILQGMIDTAGNHVEAYTGLRMLTQTVRLRAGSFEDLGRLPIGPVMTITGVEYLAAEGGVVTLDPAQWEQFGFGLSVGVRPAFGASWPRARRADDAIRITAEVGHGATFDEIPPAMRHACYLLLGDFFMNREDTVAQRSVTPTTLPNGVTTLLTNYRMF